MNADKLTESMVSTTSARDDTVSVYGKNSKTYLIACQLQPSLTTKYSVCMVDFHQNSLRSHSYNRSPDRLKFLRMASYAICFGPTQRRPRAVGERMTEALAIHLERLS